jgi:hypothetical protein
LKICLLIIVLKSVESLQINKNLIIVKMMDKFKYLIFISFIDVCILGNISIALEPNESYKPKVITQEPNKIIIFTKQKEIEAGEPLLFGITYIYSEPIIDPETGEPAKTAAHSASLKTYRVEGDEIRPFWGGPLWIFITPDVLFLIENSTTNYSNKFFVFSGPSEAGRRIITQEPGVYRIQISGWRKNSNLITIKIKPPSKMMKKALTLLSDPNDISFLNSGGGEYEYGEKLPDRFLHLKKVVDECEGTVLSKWCAARLGIEYFKDFHNKYPSFIKFKEKREKENFIEPLFDDTVKYLERAYNLPDEFPIREEVLEKLLTVEYIKGNYDKANSLIEEAAQKYPHNKLGKNAPRSKEELLRLRQKEKSDQSEKNDPNKIQK